MTRTQEIKQLLKEGYSLREALEVIPPKEYTEEQELEIILEEEV